MMKRAFYNLESSQCVLEGEEADTLVVERSLTLPLLCGPLNVKSRLVVVPWWCVEMQKGKFNLRVGDQYQSLNRHQHLQHRTRFP